LAAVAVYANSLRGGFVFDDVLSTVKNPTLRQWSTAFFPPHRTGYTVEGRPLLNVSLALNWAIGGPQVWSYHLLNLLIHLAAGLTLLGILRRVVSPAAALVVSLLWVTHPLQTESVAYIVQRAESLMGLFYLLSLYCFIRAAESSEAGRAGGGWSAPSGRAGIPPGQANAPGGRVPPSLYGVGCVAACWLGMSTKESMVSAPLMILLFDRAFISGSVRAAWQRHRRIYLGLFGSWLWLALLVLGTGNRGHTSGFGSGISVAEYWPTQLPAIAHYLHLVFWPAPLIFDYGTQWVTERTTLIAPAVLVGGLLIVTLVGLSRNRRWAVPMGFFLPCWLPTA
jgi:hypothetical protein